MTKQVYIEGAKWRNMEIPAQMFTLVGSDPIRQYKLGLYARVDGTPVDGLPDGDVKVKINSVDDVHEDYTPAPKRSDEELMEAMRRRFHVLDDMTRASIDGIVRGMIVSGPPGIGKSFGVEQIVDEAIAMNGEGGAVKFGVEKGAASPIGLYQLLYEYSAPGSLLVLDDSDTMLYDETSLNLLKAALDSGKHRRLAWRSESKALEVNEVPKSFEFEGAIIFISNLNFEDSRGKIGAHLEALMSRCHYLDMGIDGEHEKFLRCKQIVQDGMLDEYGFENGEEEEILAFVKQNQPRLRELSLRMVTKIADLRRFSDTEWRTYAENTCLKMR